MAGDLPASENLVGVTRQQGQKSKLFGREMQRDTARQGLLQTFLPVSRHIQRSPGFAERLTEERRGFGIVLDDQRMHER